MHFEQSQLLKKELTVHEQKASYSFEAAGSSATETEKPLFELRLLGLRYEQAMNALQRQLDLCVMNSFKNFSVIHGKGTGALQQGVHDFLSNNPAVKNFSFAPPQDGGFGKTYVELF